MTSDLKLNFLDVFVFFDRLRFFSGIRAGPSGLRLAGEGLGDILLGLRLRNGIPVRDSFVDLLFRLRFLGERRG